MRILVLGAAAGGGFPQWNCNCEVCRAARRGDGEAHPRTQSSIAVSADGRHWFLINASPDLRQQISERAALWPLDDGGRRSSAIAGAVLTNGDVDHVAGLLNLRESQPLSIYATPRILKVLAGNVIFDVLNPDFVRRQAIELDQSCDLDLPDGRASGLQIRPFAVPGKVALYLEDAQASENFGSQSEDTIGLEIQSSESGAKFFHIPGCAAMSDDLAARLKGAALVFFDGTLWRDDEMVHQGAGIKTGQRMGHMSMSGPDGSIAVFQDLDVARRVFIHINNTNPVLLERSDERREAEAAGWEIAYDGMEIAL